MRLDPSRCLHIFGHLIRWVCRNSWPLRSSDFDLKSPHIGRSRMFLGWFMILVRPKLCVSVNTQGFLPSHSIVCPLVMLVNLSRNISSKLDPKSTMSKSCNQWAVVLKCNSTCCHCLRWSLGTWRRQRCWSFSFRKSSWHLVRVCRQWARWCICNSFGRRQCKRRQIGQLHQRVGEVLLCQFLKCVV